MIFVVGDDAVTAMNITGDGRVAIKATSFPQDFGNARGHLLISSTDDAGANNYGVLLLQGHSISNDVGIGGIYFYDHDNNTATIQVQRDDSTSKGNMLFYTNGGSGVTERMRIKSTGEVFINQDNNNTSINIDSEATTEPVIQVDTPQSTTHPIINLTNLDSLTTGGGLRISSNSSDNTARSLLFVENDHASASGTTVANFKNDSTGYGLFVDQNGEGNAIGIDSESTGENVLAFVTPATTTATVVGAVNANSLTSGRVAYFHSDSTSNTGRELVTIQNDNSSATGAIPLAVKQDANYKVFQLEAARGDYSNTMATFNLAQLCALKMIKTKNRKKIGGAIVNMSSQMGHVGGPIRSVYNMTKFGLEGLTKGMSIDLAKYNIRVNTVCPTFVVTPMTSKFLKSKKFKKEVLGNIPLGKFAELSDVASAAVFLASDAASMITGTSLLVDGGWTAK